VARRFPSVQVIDALPELRDAERRGTVLYLNNDSHLNERGQEALASLLRRRIPAPVERSSTPRRR